MAEDRRRSAEAERRRKENQRIVRELMHTERYLKK
jgi:hypothetical protein